MDDERHISADPALLAVLRELRKQICKEHDATRLHTLVVEINRILDAIEEQLSKLESTQRT